MSVMRRSVLDIFQVSVFPDPKMIEGDSLPTSPAVAFRAPSFEPLVCSSLQRSCTGMSPTHPLVSVQTWAGWVRFPPLRKSPQVKAKSLPSILLRTPPFIRSSDPLVVHFFYLSTDYSAVDFLQVVDELGTPLAEESISNTMAKAGSGVLLSPASGWPEGQVSVQYIGSRAEVEVGCWWSLFCCSPLE